MPTLNAKAAEDKKRTALYMNQKLYETFEDFAEANGVSFNRAAIYLMEMGLAAVNAKKKSA